MNTDFDSGGENGSKDNLEWPAIFMQACARESKSAAQNVAQHGFIAARFACAIGSVNGARLLNIMP